MSKRWSMPSTATSGIARRRKTRLAEIASVLAESHTAMRRLAEWMKCSTFADDMAIMREEICGPLLPVETGGSHRCPASRAGE
jgi:hypothetical protein